MISKVTFEMRKKSWDYDIVCGNNENVYSMVAQPILNF